MLSFSKFFSQGLRSTLRVLNGTNFSYKGPWVAVNPNTVIDEWYVGEFMSAEYTIAVENTTFSKEIIKCLVVAGPDTATVNVFGRSNLGFDLVSITATVDSSKVQIIVDPAVAQDGSTVYLGSKLIFSANYYYTINELSV